MEYNHKEIEESARRFWRDADIYKAAIDASRPKYYVLDMFPYPSGPACTWDTPLGYIASDIYARYKRLKGFNVLHPMGYDAYGLRRTVCHTDRTAPRDNHRRTSTATASSSTR